jgi:hypothetical protein
MYEEMRLVSDNIVEEMSSRIDDFKSEFGESLSLSEAVSKVLDSKKVLLF